MRYTREYLARMAFMMRAPGRLQKILREMIDQKMGPMVLKSGRVSTKRRMAYKATVDIATRIGITPGRVYQLLNEPYAHPHERTQLAIARVALEENPPSLTPFKRLLDND